jgi:DNA-binding transcriptional ArsR family regulator
MAMARSKPLTNISNTQYAKALGHPLRVRILALLEEQEASPVKLAEILDEPVGVVAYHVRTLRNIGLIELVKTRQRRGATEHYYRALDHPRIDDKAWEALPVVSRQRLLSAMLQQIGEYATGSAAAGGFDRADAHITRTAMELDAQGWAELAEASKDWLRTAAQIERESAARMEADPHAEPMHVGLVILLFEALPFSRRGKRAKAAGGSRTRRAKADAAAR